MAITCTVLFTASAEEIFELLISSPHWEGIQCLQIGVRAGPGESFGRSIMDDVSECSDESQRVGIAVG